MALASLTLTGQAALAAKSTTSRVAIPAGGSPTTLVITNLGSVPAFVVLGDANVEATVAAGFPILPGNASVPLAVGSATYVAAITANAIGAPLRISAGT